MQGRLAALPPPGGRLGFRHDGRRYRSIARRALVNVRRERDLREALDVLLYQLVIVEELNDAEERHPRNAAEDRVVHAHTPEQVENHERVLYAESRMLRDGEEEIELDVVITVKVDRRNERVNENAHG